MSIIIGADFVPTKSNYSLFQKPDIDSLVGIKLKSILDGADYKVFNLECPLCELQNPIKKVGPNISAPIECVRGYVELGIDLFTLANNHILDYGSDGLYYTIEVLSKNKIDYFGAGENLEAAKIPFIKEIKGCKYGFYGCVEHEFSYATKDSCGANPFCSFSSFTDINRLRKQVDYLIVLYHGGKELYRYPSPKLQQICRGIIDAGADLVICQHSHCIGAEEKYNKGTIVYGQGNFLFDYSNNEFWNTGLLINISDNREISYIPVVKKGNTVKYADDVVSSEIMHQFFDRSDKIKDPNFILDEYRLICEEQLNHYLLQFAGITDRSLLFWGINKVTRGRFEKQYLRHRFNEKRLLAILNTIECETHNELAVNAIRNKVFKEDLL